MTPIRSIRLICAVLAEAVIRGRGEALEGAEVATEVEQQPEGAASQVKAILEEERHEEETAAILEEAQLSAEPGSDWGR